MTPKEYVAQFDEMFLTEKNRINKEWAEYWDTGKKPEPYGMMFGIKSGELNRALRTELKDPEDLKAEPPESLDNRIRLKWAYAYWWNRVHLLEHISKSKLGNARTKKNIEKGGDTLKRLISGDLSISKVHPQFKMLIETLNNMKVSEAGFVRKSGELFNGGNSGD
jgi:hypothetical protein